MDFNALDLLASAAVLQTRDSDTSDSNGTPHQSGTSDGNSEQSADNDEDSDSKLNTKKKVDSLDTNMGSMTKKGDSSGENLPKPITTSEIEQMVYQKEILYNNHKLKNPEKSVPSPSNVQQDSVDSKSVPSSDTDSCVEEDIDVINSEQSTSMEVDMTSLIETDNSFRNKTIMQSLITVSDDSDITKSNIIDCKNANCDEETHDKPSVLGNCEVSVDNSAMGLIIVKNTECDSRNKLVDIDQTNPCLSVETFEMADTSEQVGAKCNNANLHDSALESSQSTSDSSAGDPDYLHFLVVSDHCYASVPGKTASLRYSFIEGDDQESDSGIDGNSSSEEAEHRTRSLSLDSNCLQCGYPELSGRSGPLLSQGSSDLDRSPILGHSGYNLGISVLSPTLSSSDSQCSDYHHSSVSLVENASIQKYDSGLTCDGKKYKTVDFDLDNTEKVDTSSGHDLSKVGKFRIGKFASFTNIEDNESDKIFSPDPFSIGYSISPSLSTGMPASPGIPSLLQSPCGDWDRSDAGSEVLDDIDSIPTPEEPKELMMVLQGIKSPQTVTQTSFSSVVYHDHDYCFRSGYLPTIPIGINRKSVKGEKRKYMTAARSRGTNAFVKEPKKSKTLKIKNRKEKGLSDTIEKVKNSLASAPVALDCNFKKPEQPANSFLLDKINPLNRQKRLKSLEIKEEEVEEELDAGSKLKITGKFQNDFVYFLNKTSRNRRRASVEAAIVNLESRKLVQPAKPIDIIVPHLTDDDLEVVQNKGRAGLAMLEKFSANPHLLDRFSATLQAQTKICGVDALRIKSEKNMIATETMDDDKIINTILSMENDNLGSPVPDSDGMYFYDDEETINLMGENMTLTKDQVDLLLNAVKDLSTHEELLDNKTTLVSPDCGDQSSTCSTEILDANNTDVANQEWTSKEDMVEKLDNEDTESTYSSSDIGHSSSVSDIKEDSQESFELKDGEIEIQPVRTSECLITNAKDHLVDKRLSVDSDMVSTPINIENDRDVVDDSIKMDSDIDKPINIDNDLVDKSINVNSNFSEKPEDLDNDPSLHIDGHLVDKSLTLDNDLVDKSITIDNDSDLNHPALVDTKPDKSLLDSELHGFSHSLGPSLSDLGLPLEKSFELLENDFRLDKSDELFPEAQVEPPMEPSVSDYNDTPWVVTVTIFWNDLPAIMINNRPYLRLVDIHKQILPAKDTGILKKRCQLLSIHVLNCSEMQRYFLVQYGRGYSSKSTLIISKTDACRLVGYYAQPQPRIPRTEESVLQNLSRLTQHMAIIRGKPSAHGRLIRKKRPGSRVANRNISPERKNSIKTEVLSAPPSPRVRKPPPLPVVQTELSKRLRHKKINFLEMLKGDSSEKVEEHGDKKPSIRVSVVNKQKAENKKSVSKIIKKKEVEIEFCSDTTSGEEEEEEDIDKQISSSDTGSEAEEIENRLKNRQIVKLTPINNKRSPNNRSPNGNRSQLQKLGPLRVRVKGLLHFPKPVKKSAITKNESRGLDVVHTPYEFKDGVIPISQSGILLLDLYKKKSSLCVRCIDCEKMLSVTSFLQHQHYPKDSKTLTSVLETQTLSTKSCELSRNVKQMWEEFQNRHEKFDGNRFSKPVVKAVEMNNGLKKTICEMPESLSVTANVVNVDVEENTLEMLDEEAPVEVPTPPCESVNSTPLEQMESVCENLPPRVCVDKNLPPPIHASGERKYVINSYDTNCSGNLQASLACKMEECPIDEKKEHCTSHVTHLTRDTEIAAEGLDKSGVRSSSRKRKSRQYFSFEDYSFSNKKKKMVEESCECNK